MTSALQLTPGVVIGGDFEVERILELGGMGAVYVARQLSTNKPRALKLMHPQLVADPRLRQRFEQEARVGSLIESSHVVEVIAAGVDEDTGAPWIAMELLDGLNLGDYAQEHGCLSPDELLELLRQVGHALGAAHRAGVVHRDIKPENIFVAQTLSSRNKVSVKVLDFGIAKVAQQAKTTATSTVGSPAWMAPEQTDPKASITPHTDCWALGLMAFWLLTGYPFWKTAGDPEASMHALMKEILFSDIPSASERAAELGVAGRLPEGFDAWFARCVERDVDARFENADELVDAFEAMLSEPTPRAVVHTSMPPASQSPQSFAHGETQPLPPPSSPLRSGVDARTNDEPVSSKPLMLAAASRVASTVDDDESVAPRRGDTEPMTARRVRSATGEPTVAEAGPPTERAPAVGSSERSRSMALAGAGVLALGAALWAASTETPAPDLAQSSPTVTASTRPSSASPSVAPPTPVAPSPAELPSATPSATADASAAGPPPAPNKPRAPAGPKIEPKRSFDYAIAQRKLDTTAARAARGCRVHGDARSTGVRVTFKHTGSVTNVAVVRKPGEPFNVFQHCVKAPFLSLRVPPFDGSPVTLSTVVSP